MHGKEWQVVHAWSYTYNNNKSDHLTCLLVCMRVINVAQGAIWCDAFRCPMRMFGKPFAHIVPMDIVVWVGLEQYSSMSRWQRFYTCARCRTKLSRLGFEQFMLITWTKHSLSTKSRAVSLTIYHITQNQWNRIYIKKSPPWCAWCRARMSKECTYYMYWFLKMLTMK